MKGVGVFLFFCVALATANVVERNYETKEADKDFLHKQENIYKLFYHIHQPNLHDDQVELGKSYSIEDNTDKYTDPQYVKNFINYYKYDGVLKKGGIFTISEYEQIKEVKALFELLYHAKDFETFYNTACWAREHVNEQMFVYAFSAAILHRSDCQGFVLPAPYEIFPYYFFPNEVIQKTYEMKMQGHPFEHDHTVKVDNKNVVITTNYTGWYLDWNEEQILSYFTEDIGLNSFYYYYHLDYPFWMDGEKYGLKKDRRGEIFYFIHQQLLARYYMERLSNGLGEIPEFSWHMPVSTGYYPSLQYHNGLEFPIRPNHYDLHHPEYLQHLIQVEDYERRIRDAIDQGYLETKDGKHIDLKDYKHIEYLASIIEGNADSPNYPFYKYAQHVARMLLGNSVRPINWHSGAPSALENYQTCLRDPAFYQLFKRYIGFFTQFQNTLQPYTVEELGCPGVKIENVEVEKLVTYMDHYDSEITNVVYHTKEEKKNLEDDMIFKVRQRRLNHKAFTVTTNLMSEKPMPVVVKYFLGPRFNGKGQTLTLEEQRHNFYELDQFVYELKAGKNTIQRNSKDFMWNVRDWTPARSTWTTIHEALDSKTKLNLNMYEAHNGFPDRLILPKGWTGGMPAYFFVFVYPYHPPTVAQGTGYDHVLSSGVGSGARQVDDTPFGFPFNKPVREIVFDSPNMHFEKVQIFHKSDINHA